MKLQITAIAIGIILLVLANYVGAQVVSLQAANAQTLNSRFSLSTEFRIEKDFTACKAFKEYKNFAIPNVQLKIFDNQKKRVAFEAHFGKIQQDSRVCTLFFEKKSRYCQLYCYTPVRSILRAPPVPYPARLSEKFLGELARRQEWNPNWSARTPALNVPEVMLSRNLVTG